MTFQFFVDAGGVPGFLLYFMLGRISIASYLASKEHV